MLQRVMLAFTQNTTSEAQVTRLEPERGYRKRDKPVTRCDVITHELHVGCLFQALPEGAAF